MSPSLGFFWNFELQIVTSGVWWIGKSCPKMKVNKNWRSLPLEPPLVALLLEQAVCIIYELTLPKRSMIWVSVLLLLLSKLFTCFSMCPQYKSMASSSTTVTELSNKSAPKLEKKVFNFLLKSTKLRLSSWSSSAKLSHTRGHDMANARPEIVLVLVFGTTGLPLAAVSSC